MTPIDCIVSHDPASGRYGDCLRACVASVLDIDDANDVEHFFRDTDDGEIGNERLRVWLATRGYAPFFIAYDGSFTRDALLDYLGEMNPTTFYILYGGTAEASAHVVVCRGGAVVHNPAWYGSEIVGPIPSVNMWLVLVLSRL